MSESEAKPDVSNLKSENEIKSSPGSRGRGGFMRGGRGGGGPMRNDRGGFGGGRGHPYQRGGRGGGPGGPFGKLSINLDAGRPRTSCVFDVKLS